MSDAHLNVGLQPVSDSNPVPVKLMGEGLSASGAGTPVLDANGANWLWVYDKDAGTSIYISYVNGQPGAPAFPLRPDADADGTDATGVSQLPGGTGVRGWLSGIFARLSAFSLGGGNVDAGTQRVTLAADGPGVGQLTSISTAQTISIGAAPVVAVGATSAMSAVVGAGCTRVVLCPTVDSWIAVGANPTAAKATSGSIFLAAGAQSYPIVVTPGTTRIAVIADGATGIMSIIESA